MNAAGGNAFADFLLSAEAQAMIGEFGVDEFGQQLFVPDGGKTESEPDRRRDSGVRGAPARSRARATRSTTR